MLFHYLPLNSPAPKRYTVQNAVVSSFEDELVEIPITESKFSPTEEALFQTRWENGYDLTTDHRYNQWVATKKAKCVEVKLGTHVYFSVSMTTMNKK